MDTESFRKQLQKHTFRANNGQIMRTVNMLKPQESTLGNIEFLLQGETQESIQNSLNYLTEAGYIRITGVNGEAFKGRLERENRNYRIALTASGMELLMGIQESPAVDV